MNENFHVPVLMQEFLGFFKDLKINIFVDGTLGAGGHSFELLKHHPEIKKLIGFDQDRAALEIAKKKLQPFKEKVIFVEENFCNMDQELKKLNLDQVDGIFADIGVSSMQLDQKERGFSFSKDGPLDMRMDQRCELTAEDIVNDYSEQELGDILREYGEVPRWRFIAQKIVEIRQKKRIKTTQELTKLLEPFVKRNPQKKIHPMTLIFQALRIAVNNELLVLNHFLPRGASLLKRGGRLGVISFHSGEDRLVKNAFKELLLKKEIELLTKKPLVPSEEECKNNPRARSAKMRFIEKL